MNLPPIKLQHVPVFYRIQEEASLSSCWLNIVPYSRNPGQQDSYGYRNAYRIWNREKKDDGLFCLVMEAKPVEVPRHKLVEYKFSFPKKLREALGKEDCEQINFNPKKMLFALLCKGRNRVCFLTFSQYDRLQKARVKAYQQFNNTTDEEEQIQLIVAEELKDGKKNTSFRVYVDSLQKKEREKGNIECELKSIPFNQFPEKLKKLIRENVKPKSE